MKAAKEHKPQQSRVISCPMNKSIYQLSPWLPIDHKVREIDLETGNLRDKETQKEYKPITVPDTFKVENIKAASINDKGIGSLYFEKNNEGIKEQQRIRFVHDDGPKASRVHKNVHWEVIGENMYEFKGVVARLLSLQSIKPSDSIENYLNYTTLINKVLKDDDFVKYNNYVTDKRTARKLKAKKDDIKTVADLNFHKSRGVPMIWNTNPNGTKTETSGPVTETTTNPEISGIKQDGIDALYRTAYECESMSKAKDIESANMLMHLVVRKQIELKRLPEYFSQDKVLFGNM